MSRNLRIRRLTLTEGLPCGLHVSSHFMLIAAVSQGPPPSPFYRWGTQARLSCYLNGMYKGYKVGFEARQPGPRACGLNHEFMGR